MIAGVGIAVLSGDRGPDVDPERVVVAPLTNQTGDPEFDVFGQIAADWISEGLQRTGLVGVVPSMTAQEHARRITGTDVSTELANATGAGIVVSGTAYLQGDSLQIHTQVVDGATGEFCARFQSSVRSQATLQVDCLYSANA